MIERGVGSCRWLRQKMLREGHFSIFSGGSLSQREPRMEIRRAGASVRCLPHRSLHHHLLRTTSKCLNIYLTLKSSQQIRICQATLHKISQVRKRRVRSLFQYHGHALRLCCSLLRIALAHFAPALYWFRMIDDKPFEK
jgi:hypothetical protein